MTVQLVFVQGAGGGSYDEDSGLVENLQRNLGTRFAVHYPRMPNEDDPSYETWQQVIAQEFGRGLEAFGVELRLFAIDEVFEQLSADMAVKQFLGDVSFAQLIIENYAVPRGGIYNLRFSPRRERMGWVTWDATFWNGFTGGDGPFMQGIVDDFNAQRTPVTVSMVTVRWQEYYSKVPAAVSTGHGPDVAIMHVTQLASFAVRDVLVPLDDVAASLGLSREDFFPQVWDAGVFRGHRYGIPLDTHPLGLYWNEELFRKAGLDGPPTSRAELGTAVKKLQAAGVAHPFWMPSLWPAHQTFMTFLWQFGGEPYDARAARATFDSDAGVEAMRFMQDAIRQGWSPPNVGLDAQYIAFKNGQNAMTMDGIWQINDVASSLPGGRAAPVPVVGSRPAVWSDSHNFVIPRKGTVDPARVAAAKTFIRYVSDHSLDWAEAGQVPARTAVRESAAFRKLGAQSRFAQEVPYVRYTPPQPSGPHRASGSAAARERCVS